MTLSKTLFLAWQDKEKTRRWFPVGRLDANRALSRYQFRYVHGAEEANSEMGFAPLDDFPDFYQVYESSELFPLFQNRVLGESRKDFADYLKWLDLEPKSADPVEILAVNGGYRATDSFEVFPKIDRQRDGSFVCRFFLHGSRHVNSFAQKRIEELRAGERLSVALELTNPATAFAVQIQTLDYHMIGWSPRYLVADLAHALASAPGSYEAAVIRINPAPAPSKQRLLIEFRGRWPANYQPMSGPEFEPLGADLLYRRIEISRLGGILPEKIGSFVVGIPRKIVEDFRKQNPSVVEDGIFRTLLSVQEHQKMRDLLKIPFAVPTLDEQFGFTGTAAALGRPTFEGEEGRKFWLLERDKH
jgi:hypothetical protein